MNENENRIAEKLAVQIPKLNPERRERLGLIMEVTAMVLDAYEQIEHKAAQPAEKEGA